MIKLSLKIDVSLGKLVIACIGSVSIYGISCYISNLNDSPAQISDKGEEKVHDRYLPEVKDEKSKKEIYSEIIDTKDEIVKTLSLEKSVSNSNHQKQVSETKIEKTAKDEINASYNLQPDLNDKVSETKIEQISKEEIDASNDSKSKFEDKVSKSKAQIIVKKEINASNHLQSDLNEKNGANQIVENFESVGNKNDQQTMKQYAIIMDSLFYQLTSYLEHNYKFIEAKLDEIDFENINTIAEVGNLRSAVEYFSDKFKNNNNFVADDNFTGPDLFKKFASRFQKVVEALLDDIIDATEPQSSNKSKNKRRKFFVNKGKMLEYFKNFMQNVLTVFEENLSFIEKILPPSKLSREEILNHVENWNDNYKDLSNLLKIAQGKTKEITSTKLLADKLNKLALHTNDVLKYFSSVLL